MQELPALVALTYNVSFAGFPLRIQAVELLVEALFCGLAGIDRAAEWA
jgi:hypothetical protein